MKVIIFLMMILALQGFVNAQNYNDPPAGKIQRDASNAIPVIAFYDSAAHIIYMVGNEHPLPVTDRQSTGFYGSTLVTGTTTAVGSYFAIQVLNDAVIDSLVDAGRDGDAVNGLAVTAGTIIYGKNISRIKLTSGKVLAYKKGG